jgi:hypothetical protein
MVGLKELTFFEKCLSKYMAQAIARNHYQLLGEYLIIIYTF